MICIIEGVLLCRREGIVANLYYRWSKEFLDALPTSYHRPAIRASALSS